MNTILAFLLSAMGIAYGKPASSTTKFDVVIVGGGLGGLTSAFYLTQGGLKVLLVEKAEHLGGLASGLTTDDGVKFDRGAAYWTNTYDEEQKILDDIGLGRFKRFEIHEPIDSYLWNGKFYPGIWEIEKTMDELPQSFRLFKFELAQLSKSELIPNQPIEEADQQLLVLDQISSADWIKSIPLRVANRAQFSKNQKIRVQAGKILEKFNADERVRKDDGAQGMKDVLDFLDLYTRSALGALTGQISAVAFANFYSSEIEPRYTSELGTGIASIKITEKLAATKHLWESVTSAPVTGIKIKNDSECRVETVFDQQSQLHTVCSDFVVFAAQLKDAPKVIENLAKFDHSKVEAISRLGYSHYSVHILHTKGHPFRETYDTWVRGKNYRPDHFTDLILGRWMNPKIRGYNKFREGTWVNGEIDYEQKEIVVDGKEDDHGILSIYHPLPPEYLNKPYDAKTAQDLMKQATIDMLREFQPLTTMKIEIVKSEAITWPFSVHIPAVNFFSKDAKLLRRRTGRIFYAHSNIGTPAFEEALFRGHCAAYNILKITAKDFKPKHWTRCPIEQELN